MQAVRVREMTYTEVQEIDSHPLVRPMLSCLLVAPAVHRPTQGAVLETSVLVFVALSCLPNSCKRMTLSFFVPSASGQYLHTNAPYMLHDKFLLHSMLCLL